MKNLRIINAAFLTTFFGLGKLISTTGSCIFAVDKFFTRYNLHNNKLLIVSTEVLSVITGATPIALTRLPEMWNKFSNKQIEDKLNQNSQNKIINEKAKNISYSFGFLVFITAFLTGLNAYLGGVTIAKHTKVTGVFVKVIGSYVGISSILSFTIYSSLKVIHNSYDAFLVLIDKEKRKNFRIGKHELFILGLTCLCVTSSGTMYYFSIKHSLPLFLSDIFNIKSFNKKNIPIIAGASVIPSEMTLIFSQVAQAKKYFKETDTILFSRHNGIKNNCLYFCFLAINLLSIIIQSVIYYEYMYDLLEDLGIEGGLSIMLSILNALGSAFIYYTFTARPAIIKTNNFLSKQDEKNNQSSLRVITVVEPPPQSLWSVNSMNNSATNERSSLIGSKKKKYCIIS